MNTWEETPRRTLGDRRMRLKGRRWLDRNRGRRSRARPGDGTLTARGAVDSQLGDEAGGGTQGGSPSQEQGQSQGRQSTQSSPQLRRGAERGRGEAEEGQRERRCDTARPRENAHGTSRGAAGSRGAAAAAARAGGGAVGAGVEEENRGKAAENSEIWPRPAATARRLPCSIGAPHQGLGAMGTTSRRLRCAAAASLPPDSPRLASSPPPRCPPCRRSAVSQSVASRRASHPPQ